MLIVVLGPRGWVEKSYYSNSILKVACVAGDKLQSVVVLLNAFVFLPLYFAIDTSIY